MPNRSRAAPVPPRRARGPAAPCQLTCAALGAAAVALALFVDGAVGDRTGAALLLILVACLVGLFAVATHNKSR